MDLGGGLALCHLERLVLSVVLFVVLLVVFDSLLARLSGVFVWLKWLVWQLAVCDGFGQWDLAQWDKFPEVSAHL